MKAHSFLDHILEYENHSGLDNAWSKIPGSKVRHPYLETSLRAPFTFAQHEKAHEALRPLLSSRAIQLAQEFAFMPTSPPRNKGGIFELRAYQLTPGTLLEWEATWYAFCAMFGCYAVDCVMVHKAERN
jgi:hypothetical protein